VTFGFDNLNPARPNSEHDFTPGADFFDALPATRNKWTPLFARRKSVVS
jgi:hypothetical protein